MIVALALLAAAQDSAVSATVEQDIVVTAQRLQATTVSMHRNAQGRLACSLDRSSGVPKLDRQLCRAAGACVREGARDQGTVAACVDRRKPALLADLRRAVSRGRAK